jgi:mannosyltransferase
MNQLNVTIDGIIFSLQRNGGISVYFATLLKFLRDRDIDTSLMLYENSSDVLDFLLPNISPARPMERYRACPLFGASSVFHSSYYRKPSNPKIPSVVTVYDFNYEKSIKGFRRWVHSNQKFSTIRSAQSIICISEATKRDLLHYVGIASGQSIEVIHCGVSSAFHPITVAKPVAPFVLYVGQRGGYKNFRLALAAMEFLPDFELHCVGGGHFSREEFIGVPFRIIDRVKYLGALSDAKLNIVYNQAICLIYPSEFEGFGIPVVEAMRAGCPVVSGECDAVREVGQDALLVAHDYEPRSFANCINLASSQARNDFVSRGIHIADKFSWVRAHEKTLEIYQKFS